ncbi:hypothetical protein Tco_1482111 [Tanacetum coccineum]
MGEKELRNMLDSVTFGVSVLKLSMLHYLHVQLLGPPGLKKSHMIPEYDVSHFSTICILESLHGWPRSLRDSTKWHSLFTLRSTMK